MFGLASPEKPTSKGLVSSPCARKENDVREPHRNHLHLGLVFEGEAWPLHCMESMRMCPRSFFDLAPEFSPGLEKYLRRASAEKSTGCVRCSHLCQNLMAIRRELFLSGNPGARWFGARWLGARWFGVSCRPGDSFGSCLFLGGLVSWWFWACWAF